MKQAVRGEALMVKEWKEEGGKIYLHAENGKKYRYVGRHKLSHLKKHMPKGTGLYVGIVLNGTKEILVDDQISLC